MAGASNTKASFKNFKRESQIIPEKTITLIKSHIEKNNLRQALSVIHNASRDIKTVPLNIAVIGETGAGKSTFINALRGLGQEDKGAAPTGMIETTMKRTPYPHPKLPQVTIWDLPGIGSPSFPPENYLTEMKFAEYDFFIIISAVRTKGIDVQLAKAIAKMKMNSYFVRTKIDIELCNESVSKPITFNKEDVLMKIREDCSKQLKGVLSGEPQIFLVSNFDTFMYDFPKLQMKLQSDILEKKHDIFMLHLKRVTEDIINRKRSSLSQKARYEAFKDGAWAFVPILGMIRNEYKNLKRTLNWYRSDFGLDDASLQKIANDFNTSVNELKAHLQFPHLLADDVSLGKRLGNIAVSTGFSIFGAASSFYFRNKSYDIQEFCIDTLANDSIALLNIKDLFEKKVGPFTRKSPDHWE